MSLPSPFSPSAIVSFAVTDSTDFATSLESGSALEVDEVFASRFGTRRRTDFLLGRMAARAALRKAGLATIDALLEPGEHGIPNWPAGIVGSISHSRGVAVAAVASANDAYALGVDIERQSPRSLQFLGRIASESEQRWAMAEPGSELFRALLIFSAKESVFKTLFPICRKFFGFDAVELSQLSASKLAARLLVDLSPELRRGFTVEVNFVNTPEFVITGALIAHFSR